MALPEQIRRQDEAVQELYKQINGEDTEQPEEGGVVQPPADDTQDQADDQPVEESAVPSPAPADDERVPEETVLQKYKTLQGMYNAEVPRLHQQNRELSQRVQQMEQLLASLNTQKEASAKAAPVVEKYISEADVAEYGDSLDVMRRVSREELNPVASRLARIEETLQALQSNVVPQIQAVSKRQAASAEQQFWADLTSAVPDWREVNDNQEFQTWLLETDPLTGIARQTYLEEAQRQLDARRVANFFGAWMNTTGRASVAQSAGRASAPKSELEKQVTPGRSRNTGTPAANKGKVWTPQDITKFFDDVRAGRYAGREQERDRLERDIFAAQRENRIQS